MAFYVTTPIFYVNAAPHLGHAYTTIAADVLARHMRQRGEEVFFLTGTDEHGEPVAQAAEREGVTPKELADRNAERFQALMPVLGASNDFFIRTSDAEHVAKVQEVLTRVKDAGHVYEGRYEGWYCPRCADFKTDAEQGPDHTCLVHEIPLTRESEQNWFFRLSAFQEQLDALHATEFVQPATRRNEARAFVAQGLQDVSLSRNNLTWGVTVPWDPEHVFYVWWDALLNYYSALGYARPGTDLTGTFWGAPTHHLIGKDILKFHTVYWPALLMAAGLELPKQVFVHGFLLGADGRKMSKSLGNVLDPFAVIERFGTDALRHYLMRDVPFGEDGPVGMDDVERRYDSELANGYGNLVSRTVSMVARYRDGAVPAVAPELPEEVEGLSARVAERFDAWDVTGGLEAIWAGVRALNGYVDRQAPWKLAKDPEQAGRLDVALATLVAGVRAVTEELRPVLPDSAATVLAALDADVLTPIAPLFPKQPAPAAPAAAP
jgi:methionyl-tRNA synthetase